MNEIFKSLSDSNSTTLLIGFVGFILLALLREYFRFFLKLKGIREKKNEPLDKENQQPSNIGEQNIVINQVQTESEASAVVDSNFRMLDRYYDQHLTEYKLMSRATLVISILGFLVILIGVFFVLSGYASVGILTSIGGAVAEGASILFFTQNRIIMEQIREYHKKLVSTQYLLTSISLTKSLNEEKRQEEVQKIIQNLLFLSNELHNSDSSHLFKNES